jgi:hypothetical protein
VNRNRPRTSDVRTLREAMSRAIYVRPLARSRARVSSARRPIHAEGARLSTIAEPTAIALAATAVPAYGASRPLPSAIHPNRAANQIGGTMAAAARSPLCI